MERSAGGKQGWRRKTAGKRNRGEGTVTLVEVGKVGEG
jgi:hypothetical protein